MKVTMDKKSANHKNKLKSTNTQNNPTTQNNQKESNLSMKNQTKNTQNTPKAEISNQQVAEAPLNSKPEEVSNGPQKVNDTQKVPKEELPIVLLPGGKTSISDTAIALANAYWKASVEKRMYTRGRNVCVLIPDACGGLQLQFVDEACAASHFESVARLRDGKEGAHDGKGGSDKVAICSIPTAKSIISSLSFKGALPKLNQISNCPVILKDKENGYRIVTSYDPESGIYCKTSQYKEIGVSEAKTLIDELLQEYNFATEGDRSRAIAALLTPALTAGGFLNDHAPIMMLQADQSQAGKGYFTMILGAIYSEIPHDISQSQGPGVGGIGDKFDVAVANGHNLLILDNLRGTLKNQRIESFVTAPSYSTRCAYTKPVDVDPKKFFIMATSNGVALSKDLANRTCFINIRKKVGFQFKRYPEGSLKDHVKTHSSEYLAAMHAIIREWVSKGAQRTDGVGHDFRDWCGVLDWIVRNIFNATPLMEGHRSSQLEAEHPDAKWLDTVFDEIKEAGATNNPMLVGEIAECSDSSTGYYEAEGLDFGTLEPRAKQKIIQELGRKLARLMEDLGSEGKLLMGGYTLVRSRERVKYPSGNTAPVSKYNFIPQA